jgi:3'-5' exoribonuclease 1
MHYIVFDLELNSKPFKSIIPNEIIEIGAIKLDSDLQKIDDFQAFVKPKAFKKLCSIIKRKTSISQTDINNAESFKTVIKRFKEWVGDNYILCSWGFDDVYHLRSNCNFNRLSDKWINPHIDIQKKLSKFYELPVGHQLSLKSALKLLTIPINLELHRADVDAKYTSEIFIRMYNEMGIQ